MSSTAEKNIPFPATEPCPITVAYGDGIGPEIMEATLLILNEARAKLNIETIEVGEKQYKTGNSTGIPADAWESLRRTNVLLKAPITTPQGGGYKSLNVTMRKTLGLYANIRSCVSYHPFVNTNHAGMDMVIVRENEEDLYAGIEYQATPDAVHAVKMITRSGSERIARYAFEYAVRNGRNKVTCMSKDNIMKQADGLFHRVFDEVAKEYPDIETDHYIIDIGSARIASRPELFDVIVTENLYGDIISDIAADVSGSVGLAGSANIGNDFAMFEAIHGSAPDISGQNIANPSGLLHGAILMLVHIGQPDVATRVHNAWLKTIEDGMHTADIYQEDFSKEKLGTQDFAKAVVERLGEIPRKLQAVHYDEVKAERRQVAVDGTVRPDVKKELVGMDVYVEWHDDVNALGDKMASFGTEAMPLQMIDSKGLKVWPDHVPGMNLTDQFRCRYMMTEGNNVSHADIPALLSRMLETGMEFAKAENLYTFDGKAGFSMGQGE